jgi:ABC-type phosphate transport system substrate-binding protein
MGLNHQLFNVVFRSFALTVLLQLAFATAALSAEYFVIANKSVPVSSLSRSEIQAIFLGEKTRWDDGKAIKLFVLSEGAVHKSFLESVVEKSPSQFEIYWKKLVFTGKAAAPKSFSDGAELVAAVATQAGAISYAAAGQSRSAVKTISVK